MAYELGTASGYTDLLERLKDFLSDPARIIGDHPNMDELVAIDDDVASGEASQAWTVLDWSDDRDTAGDGECQLYLQGPGTSGVDEIFVYIDTYSDEGTGYYNWRLCGMTGYQSGLDISLQPGRTKGRLPRMLLHNVPIDYWFIGNGRRFAVVAKVSTIYECCYGGFVLPYGLPSQFPYPLAIGGSAAPLGTASHHLYSSTENDHRGFPKPYGANAGACSRPEFDWTGSEDQGTLKIMVGDSWIMFRTRVTGDADNVTWPYSHMAEYRSGWDRWAVLKENIDGSYPVFPIIAVMENPNKNIVGELQGCFAAPGFNGGGIIVPEDTFTINGDTYIAFPTKFSADRSNFWCMKKE